MEDEIEAPSATRNDPLNPIAVFAAATNEPESLSSNDPDTLLFNMLA